MNKNQITCFAIRRADFVSSAYEDAMDSLEDDPEQDFHELINSCYEVTVIDHQYAESAEQALELSARKLGYRHSLDWLDFLNTGDGMSVTLEAVEDADPSCEPY